MPKLTALKDVGDMEMFLNNFQSHMSGFEVPAEYWMANLLSLLYPVSLRFQEQMPEEQKADYHTQERSGSAWHHHEPVPYAERPHSAGIGDCSAAIHQDSFPDGALGQRNYIQS